MKIDDPGATIQGGTACAETPAGTAGVRDVDFQKCAFRLHGANLPPLQIQYSASLWNDCASFRSLHDPLRMTDQVLEPDHACCGAQVPENIRWFPNDQRLQVGDLEQDADAMSIAVISFDRLVQAGQTGAAYSRL